MVGQFWVTPYSKGLCLTRHPCEPRHCHRAWPIVALINICWMNELRKSLSRAAKHLWWVPSTAMLGSSWVIGIRRKTYNPTPEATGTWTTRLRLVETPDMCPTHRISSTSNLVPSPWQPLSSGVWDVPGLCLCHGPVSPPPSSHTGLKHELHGPLLIGPALF